MPDEKALEQMGNVESALCAEDASAERGDVCACCGMMQPPSPPTDLDAWAQMVGEYHEPDCDAYAALGLTLIPDEAKTNVGKAALLRLGDQFIIPVRVTAVYPGQGQRGTCGQPEIVGILLYKVIPALGGGEALVPETQITFMPQVTFAADADGDALNTSVQRAVAQVYADAQTLQAVREVLGSEFHYLPSPPGDPRFEGVALRADWYVTIPMSLINVVMEALGLPVLCQHADNAASNSAEKAMPPTE